MATKFTSVQVASGADILAANENAARLDMLKNAGDYATSTGSADAYLLAVDAQISAYVAGDVFKFSANFANTGAATLNVNSIGAKSIVKNHDVALEANDIESGQVVMVTYDGTSMQMLSQKGVDLTASNILLVGGGTTTNADAAHTHNGLVTSFNGAVVVTTLDFLNDSYAKKACGFSDAAADLLALVVAAGDGQPIGTQMVEMSNDMGSSPFLPIAPQTFNAADVTPTVNGGLYIGTDFWSSCSDSGTIQKNGTSVTISGTARNGPLGHDNTNSSLLVLYSTTKIAKFSGIAGTTITNLVADVTLDTAVESTVGFLFDDANDEYVCVDTTANLVRKFNSSGVTQSTAAYTISDANVAGVCLINNRVYLVVVCVMDHATASFGSFGWSLVPTTMKRTGT